MKVSVCTITYNQQAYIGEALESFLGQQTSFDFEIVVADDASTDNTRTILEDYRSRYPDKIRLLLHEKNIGMVPNFFSAIQACKGEYIALCEGDDYWISNQKLQIQADLLDRHPEYASCFHKARIVFSGIEPFDFPDYNANTPQVTGFKDLVKGNYIHTPTCMFRNHLFPKVPDSFLGLRIGDWPLHLLNSLKGDIFFMDQEMAAYRVSSAGFWSARNHTSKIEYAMQFLGQMKQVFDKKYSSDFQSAIRNYARYLLKLYMQNRQWGKLLVNAPEFIYKGFIR